ncbi:uncharacterized protein [Acropora muricata]|uniref:uncharacterized protein n=1 Tax=Acropora muricata TaxID=159855 RepID=UPI0034E58623
MLNLSNLFRRDREANNQSRSCVGGGIVIYARDSLMGKRRYDLESNEMEQMCIEVKQHRYASFFVSSLYRPPNTNAAFFKHLTQLVELISAEAKEIHFIGDFNIDLLHNDLDEMLYIWNKLVLDFIDTHAPVKKRRVKTRDEPSWLTNEIQEAIKHRDHLKKLFDQGKIPRGTYNKARTKVVRIVYKAKTLAMKNELKENRQNSRLLWKALRKLSPSGKEKSMPNELRAPRDQANKYNKHFGCIASSVVDNNQSLNPDLSHIENFVNVRKPSTNNFEIPLLDVNSLDKLIESLPTNVATGPNGISASLLKLISPAILESLFKVLNCSIRSGICPSALKLARVTPVPKSGAASDPNNSRPISVLPIISKPLERHIYIQLMLYLR